MNNKYYLILFFITSFLMNSTTSYSQWNVNSDYWSSTDALGRKATPWYDDGAKDKKTDKFIAMFYHSWHIGNHVEYTHDVMNLKDILANNDESVIEQDWNHPAWGGLTEGQHYYWEESLYGYYRTTDEWVLRKHAEMLADAGVDVVFFDASNGAVTWKEGYQKLLEVWTQARLDGVKTPKIAFMLTLWSDITEGSLAAINELYEELYLPGEYDDLIFYWNGKPLIMAYPEILDNVPEAENASMKFKATSSFSSVTAGCPSYADNVGNLTLSLYKWNTDYNTTISQQAIASQEFVDYADNAHLYLNFGVQEAGDYLWVLDNAKQEVGVWKYDQNTTYVTSYFNGSAIGGGYHSLIKYEGASHTWLTSGTSNTPTQIGAGYDSNQINDISNYFTFRPGQGDYVNGPTYGRNDQWGWLEVYPQHGFVNKGDGTFEQMTVGISQNASSTTGGRCVSFNASGTYGRNYTKQNGWDNSENAVYKGANIQEQWDRALDVDPDIVFVTGWNEWIVGRWKDWSGCTGYAPVEVGFPDAFDAKRSRDIEPVKSWGKYGDAYYVQLVNNVRKYKGISKPEAASDSKTISIGSFDSWSDVKPDFNHYKGNTTHRNHAGAGTLNYTNNSGRNDIVKAKVARDVDNVYFYVETNENITPSSDTNWMRLFIDIDKDKSTGWEGYDYVLNRLSPGAKAILEKSTDSWSWTEVGQVDYAVSDNMMEISIPRSLLGLSPESEIQIEFKWSDNSIVDGNIMDFYVNGDAAPGGRFNFGYYTTENGLGILDNKLSNFDVKAYPNPFVKETSIQFELKTYSNVEITILNNLGQEIKNIHVGKLKAGINRIIWDGNSGQGHSVGAGTYFYRINTEGSYSKTGVIIKY